MPRKNENMIDGQNELNEEENENEILEEQPEEQPEDQPEEQNLDESYILDDDDMVYDDNPTVTFRVYNEEERRPRPQPQAEQPHEEAQAEAPAVDTVYQPFQAPETAVEHAEDYNKLEQALMGTRPVFTEYDGMQEFGRFVSALHMLSRDLDSFEQDYQTVVGPVPFGFTSKQEAWNYIHEQGRIERIRGYRSQDGKTIGEKLAETNKNTGLDLDQISATISGETWNPYLPENIQTLFHQPGRVFYSLDDFFASYKVPEYGEDLQNLQPDDVDARLNEIEERDINANGAPFDPARLQGKDKADHEMYSDLKYYSEIMAAEGKPVNSTFSHFMRFNASERPYARILQRHQNDERFIRAVRTMDHIRAVDMKLITGRELNQHVQELLERPAIQNATTPPGTLVKEVAGGDHTKFTELLNQNEAYADLLSLQYLNNLLGTIAPPEMRGDQSTLQNKYNELRENHREALKNLALDHADDPMFRRGLIAFSDSLGALTDKKTLKDLDSELNAKLMADTLAPLNAQQIKNLDKELKLDGDVEKITDAVEGNINKQTSLAKVMFLANLGKIQILENEDNQQTASVYNRSIGNLFAHGQRVTFNLPVTGRGPDLYDSIYGRDRGKNQGVYSVLSSGQIISPQTYTEDGIIDNDVQIWSGRSIKNNYAMDLPIGGYGKQSANGKTNLGTSEDGKAVIKMANGNPARNAGATMSFGIRTPKQQNNRQTPFLSDKGGDMGEEFGGRDVALYRIKDETIINLMDRFDQYYRKLQKDAISNPAKAQELAEVNKSLSGEKMSKNALVSFMTEKLNVVPADARKLYDVINARDETAMTEDKWVDIPAPEDPNAGKTPEQIKKEAQEERMRMEAGVSDKLTAGTGFKLEGEDLQQIEPEVNQPEHPTLEQYMVRKAEELRRTTSKSTQQKIICSMFAAVAMTGGDKYKTIDETKLEPRKAARIPAVEYQLKFGYTKLLHDAGTGNPNLLMNETAHMHTILQSPEEDAAQIAKLKNLYRQLNVPNLKDRSKEYQRLVKSVGKASMKETLSENEKLSLINSVRNYAEKKRVVPRTDNGKISLDLAYQALEAVMPQNQNKNSAKAQFVTPLRNNIRELRDAMDEAGLRNQEPQAGAAHLNM